MKRCDHSSGSRGPNCIELVPVVVRLIERRWGRGMVMSGSFGSFSVGSVSCMELRDDHHLAAFDQRIILLQLHRSQVETCHTSRAPGPQSPQGPPQRGLLKVTKSSGHPVSPDMHSTVICFRFPRSCSFLAANRCAFGVPQEVGRSRCGHQRKWGVGG